MKDGSQLEAFEGRSWFIRRAPEVLSTLTVTAPSNTCRSRSPASCRRQPWRMGTLRVVRFCLASTSVCRSALVASMVGAIPSAAARAFNTACRSSTMPVDSGSGFRSEGTSGHADGGSASAEVIVANSCPPCRSTSEEWTPRRPRRSLTDLGGWRASWRSTSSRMTRPRGTFRRRASASRQAANSRSTAAPLGLSVSHPRIRW